MDYVAKNINYNKYSNLRTDSVLSDSPDNQASLNLHYPQKLLDSMETESSMNDHIVSSKIRFVVMLLRYIHSRQVHVNGTRYVVVNFTEFFIFLQAISRNIQGSVLILPCIYCQSGVDEFTIPGLRRCQFPIKIFFAITINKFQGK